MTNSGGYDENGRYETSGAPTYGEIPPLPRDGYGVSESGQPTYSAPTESYSVQSEYGQRPGYGTPPPYPQYGPPPQYGAPNPYAGPNPYGYAQTPGTNGLALAALITTLAGGIFACGLGFLVGPILGLVSLGQIKRTGEQGRGMAIASIVIGAIGVLLIVGYVVLVAVLATSGNYDY